LIFDRLSQFWCKKPLGGGKIDSAMGRKFFKR
jgi:hypothetical protein